MALNDAARSTYEVVYDFNSPNTTMLFSKQLGLIRSNPSYNLMRKYGMISSADSKMEFDTPIGSMQAIRGLKERYYKSTFKGGAPMAGDDTPLRELDNLADRPWDEMSSVDLSMPAELIGTDLRNAISQAPIYIETLRRIAQWCNNMEFEAWLQATTRMRGDNTNFEVFNEPENDPKVRLRDSKPWDVWHKTVPVRDPTCVKSNTQTRDQLDGRSLDLNNSVDWSGTYTHDYTNFARADGSDNMDANTLTFQDIRNIRDYLRRRTRAKDGFPFEPAMLNIPGEYQDVKARISLPKQYVMFVHPDVSLNFKASDEWTKHQQNLIQAMGLRQGITTGYMGMVDNVLLVENDLLPTFEAKSATITNKWARCIIFGRQATVVARHIYNVPVRFRDNKALGSQGTTNFQISWNLWVEKRNEGLNSAVRGHSNFGTKPCQFNIPRGLHNPATNADAEYQQGETTRDPATRYADDPVDIGVCLYDVLTSSSGGA